MAPRPHLLLAAGDPSGDRHAARLVSDLRRRRADLTVSALGGPFLREASDRFLYPLVELGGFGFAEPLLKLPGFWRALARVKALLRQDPPSLVVPVDYYGFNIHVARAARKRSIPVVYYISPQVWASRAGRLRSLRAAVKKMLVLFPFEEAFYLNAGVPAAFVGHPLAGTLPEPRPEAGESGAIGFLPGSRPAVIRRHLPILAETARRLRRAHPGLAMALIRPVELPDSLFAAFLRSCPWIRLTTDPDYATRRALRMAFTVSGTSALELTLLGIPMVIFYRLSRLSYAVASRLARVPFIGIPNILAGRAVVPECIQADCTPDRLARAAEPFLTRRHPREEASEALRALRGSLLPPVPGAAAEEILEELAA